MKLLINSDKLMGIYLDDYIYWMWNGNSKLNCEKIAFENAKKYSEIIL